MSPKARVENRSARVAHSSELKQAIIDTLPTRLVANASLLLPALPSLLDHYLDSLCSTWASLGHAVAETERERLRQSLAQKLQEAFEHSANSRVRVSYDSDPAPHTTLTWRVSIERATMQDEYQDWTQTRGDSPFGRHPDARVIDLARSLTPAARVLDAGAGTGRNALPLAREGFQLDAVELAPALLQVLREAIAKEGLTVRALEGDLLDPTLDLPANAYALVFLSEVVSHFRSAAELHALFERADRLLCPGGYLLFNAFLPVAGFKPDAMAREMSEVMWCRLFTRHELLEAAASTSLVLSSDDATLDYERAHLPTEHWPPTPWYEDWCTGRNAFKLPARKSPMAARWLSYRKRAD